MKTPLVVALVILSLVGAVAGFYFYDQFRMSPGAGSTSSSTCRDPASISSHIYNSYRLQIVKSCMTISGTVDAVIEEADGDIHLRLLLDQTYSNLINSLNDQYQYGDLVVERICVNQPSQTDAITACQNYTNPDPGSEPWPTHHDHWPVGSGH
jgi:hypothetical protein